MKESDQVKIIIEEAGEYHYKVHAALLVCGKDIHVTFTGGEVPHIGAVALAVPRESLEDPLKTSASASVICVTGHKEDLLARDTALKLAAICKSTVTVTVGLHINKASKQDIERLLDNFKAVNESIIHILGKM